MRMCAGRTPGGDKASDCVTVPHGSLSGRPLSPYITMTATTALSQPRACGLRVGLEGVDLPGLDHGEADVVEAVEQAVLAVGVDLELHHAAIGAADFLLLEIDRE